MQWKPTIVIVPTLLSLVALQVATMETYGATSDDKIGLMATLDFQSVNWIIMEIFDRYIYRYITKITKYIW